MADVLTYNTIRPQFPLQGNTPQETFLGKLIALKSYKTHFHLKCSCKNSDIKCLVNDLPNLSHIFDLLLEIFSYKPRIVFHFDTIIVDCLRRIVQKGSYLITTIYS